MTVHRDEHDTSLIDEVIADMRRIAVVGMSTSLGKAAGSTPLQLARRGYEIVPVNPSVSEIAGLRAHARLEDVPGEIDVVDVFRPPPEAAAIATEAVRVGARAIWLQLGIVSTEARGMAEEAGLLYVEDACLWVEVSRRGAWPGARRGDPAT